MDQPCTPANSTESAEHPFQSHLQSPETRWALYARLSAARDPSPVDPERLHDEHREAQVRLDAEILALREMVRSRGGTVAGIYRDVGPASAGADLHRATYDAMMGGYDRLAVVALERLADNPVDLVSLVQKMRDVGVGVTVLAPDGSSVDDPDLDERWVAAASAQQLRRHRRRGKAALS